MYIIILYLKLSDKQYDQLTYVITSDGYRKGLVLQQTFVWLNIMMNEKNMDDLSQSNQSFNKSSNDNRHVA